MGYSGLNQEPVVAMPCNLVGMLQVSVQRDVPNFSRVRVQEEELCLLRAKKGISTSLGKPC
eukprot:3761507-Pleurochrysis_carterae.AAC.1